MCGIAGAWGHQPSAKVHRMLSRLVHRGPDAGGTTPTGDGGVLGHRRLAIMDPTGGDQPIPAETGARVVGANGEIYNFPELRETLGERHTFRTGCDTEAAVHLYEERGPRTVESLDGMFALAIAGEDDAYLARDPLGIKPLYYHRSADRFVFASELKALDGVVDHAQGFPPGCWFHPDHGLRRYYTVPDPPATRMTVEEQARKVRETLDRAVRKRLMSDVPVGAFLSGGLDSSLIAAFARRWVDPLHTFSVGIEGSRDLAAARRVAEHLGTVHHEYTFTPEEAIETLPEVVYSLESYDQDLVRSALPCYFTARVAADHVKVILTGEGSDELFAGYDYYRSIDDPTALHRELRRSVASLHEMNLQRVDRLTMAHGIEGRVPFLDPEMVNLAMRIPPEHKLAPFHGKAPMDKWILRKACEDMLPREIVWREKEQFDEGSGTADLLGEGTRRWMDERKAADYATCRPDARLRSAEECVYHQLLTDSFTDPSLVLEHVARWAARSELTAAER